MSLFKDINKLEVLDSLIRRVTKDNDYRLISEDNQWTIFEKDEQLVQVSITKNGSQEELELCATLFNDIGVGMEIFIRSILLDRRIRLMAKRDQFRRKNCKIELLRILKLNDSSLCKVKVTKQIKMFTKKAKKIKKEADDLLDYTMFIKLN